LGQLEEEVQIIWRFHGHVHIGYNKNNAGNILFIVHVLRRLDNIEEKSSSFVENLREQEARSRTGGKILEE
jgi:hypothetical protein